MAKPVHSKNDPLTLGVSYGPGFHEIEHSLCHPSRNWHLQDGVEFHIGVRYKDDDGVGPCRTTTIPLQIVLTTLMRITENLCVLGGHLKDDFREGRVDLLKTPPFQFTSYSAKKRTGHVQISYATYLRLVLRVNELERC